MRPSASNAMSPENLPKTKEWLTRNPLLRLVHSSALGDAAEDGRSHVRDALRSVPVGAVLAAGHVLAQDSFSFTCGITSDLNTRLKAELRSTRLKSSVWVKRSSSRSIQVQAFTRTPSLE
jgi:hypothetical protein